VRQVEVGEEGIMLRVERTRKTGACPFSRHSDDNRRLDETRRREQEASRKVIKRHLFLKAGERLNEGERRQLSAYLEAYPWLREWYWLKNSCAASIKPLINSRLGAFFQSLILCMEHSEDGR